MDQHAQILAVQEVVVRTLSAMGVPNAAGVVRTYLVCDRCFLGHKFRAQGVHAIWAVDSPTIRFFSDAGQLLRSVRIDEQQQDISTAVEKKSA